MPSSTLYPESLPGIDMPEVKDIFGDNPIIFIRFISRFKENFKNKGDELLDAINNQDFSTASIIAHTIKGSTAQIGAIELSKAAAQAENACREQQPDYQQHIDLTIELLNEVLIGINLYFQHASR